jgi:hypothetical protein
LKLRSVFLRCKIYITWQDWFFLRFRMLVIHNTCTIYMYLLVKYFYNTCTLLVHYMYITCTLHVHYLYNTCAILVQNLYKNTCTKLIQKYLYHTSIFQYKLKYNPTCGICILSTLENPCRKTCNKKAVCIYLVDQMVK